MVLETPRKAHTHHQRFPFLSSGTVLDGYVDYSLIVSVENDCGIPSDTQTLVIKPLQSDFDLVPYNLFRFNYWRYFCILKLMLSDLRDLITIS